METQNNTAPWALSEPGPGALLQALRVPLPEEAVTPHPQKAYLSQINSIYVIDRLNDVFGLGGWRILYEIIERREAGIRKILRKGQEELQFQETMIVTLAKFTATIPAAYGGGEISVEAFGGNDNDDLGDAYKGACTDALTKIGSFLGIGSHVWKDSKKKGQAGGSGSSSGSGLGSGSAPASQGGEPGEWLNKGTALWATWVKYAAEQIVSGSGTLEDQISKMRTKRNLKLSKKDREIFDREVLNMVQALSGKEAQK